MYLEFWIGTVLYCEVVNVSLDVLAFCLDTLYFSIIFEYLGDVYL